MNKEQLDNIHKMLNNSIYGSIWSDDDFRYNIALKQIYNSMSILDNMTSLNNDDTNNEKDINEKIVKPKINAKLI